jgi:hypothetical protein
MSNARLLRRTDVKPLPKDARVNEIVSWMAAQVEKIGVLSHWDATFHVGIRFGDGYTYKEPILKHNGEPLRTESGKIAQEEYLHPDILRAFKRLTLDTVIWEKDAHAWRKRKSPVVSQKVRRPAGRAGAS